jgi:hypothetical protein
VEHSICSGAPGLEREVQKGGRALCTLYPDDGAFTAKVTVGSKKRQKRIYYCQRFQPICASSTPAQSAFNGARC